MEVIGIYLHMRRTMWSDKYIFFQIITADGILEYPVLISNSDKSIHMLQKIGDLSQDDLQS